MRRVALPLLLMVGLLVTVTVVGCGSSKDANAPTRPLPGYSGRPADLFDDTIEPAAVGLDFDRGYSPRSDPSLRERAQTGDAVVRVKVSTVTAKRDGPDAIYQLGLQTIETVGGKHPPPQNFTVTITKASESHGIMKNFESRLVGYGFIAFIREFVRPDGDREVHFHLAPDTKEVKNAVNEALVLSEVSGK